MFTGAKIRDGSTYLEGHLSANDYYSENESVSGKWIGKGADKLGIDGQRIDAHDERFESFRQNRLPEGGKLTPRDSEDRIKFHDLQCSAEKSVSIMAITAGDSRLLDAHERCADMAFGELERFAVCQANTRTERNNLATGNLVAAKFLHTASRALDPQVHIHFVTVAATFSEELGAWRALNEVEMYRAIRYAGKVYQNAMAAECRRLGYEIRPKTDERNRIIGFEIAGVSDDIIERFSKRREQIERGIEHFVAKHGREPSAAEVHVITTMTRDPKLKEATTPEVILAQRAQLSDTEAHTLDRLKRDAMSRSLPELPAAEIGLEQESLRRAIGHCYERDCVVTGHALMAEALNQRLGRLDLEKLKRHLVGPELVGVTRLDDDELKSAYVTPAGLRREQWILAVAAEDRGTLPPLASPEIISEKLSPEQAGAVRELLSCRDRLAALRGAAGVGKTTVLTEVNRHLDEQGLAVAYCAPTASAADTLRKDGLPGAVTLASFLSSAPENRMPAGSVLIVDEAGLASHRDGMAVLRLATARDWRVIFVGDTRQHASVEAGDFLRLMESRTHLHRVELTEIRRQTERAYRDAIRQMSAGHAKDGLARLNALGWVHSDGPDYLQNAAKEYASALISTKGKADVLCVAPTWSENRTVTSAIRAELKQAGALAGGERVRVLDPLSWTTQEKREASRYRAGMVVVYDRDSGRFRKGDMATVVAADENTVTVSPSDGHHRRLSLARGNYEVCSPREIEVSGGDRLLLRANDKKLGLINGKTVEVESISNGLIQTVDGLKINTTRYARFTHGYVMTSYKSQGMTADRVIVAAASLDAKAAYVACSRGRVACSVHTPDKVRLSNSLSSGDRPLAAEQPGFIAAIGTTLPSIEPTSPKSLSWYQGPWLRLVKHVMALTNRPPEPELPHDSHRSAPTL